MDKVINKFKKDKYTYEIGYNIYAKKVYPRIEIYNDGVLLSGGCWYYGSYVGFFYFDIDCFFSDNDGYTDTIKKMFIELRKNGEIPQYIEKEYEDIFLLYKLNNFKEI